MKLFIVASMTGISTANYFVAAFQQAGHEVVVCSDVPGPTVDVIAHGLVDVAALVRARRFEPDAVVFFEGGTMRLLPDTTGLGACITAWYAIDTHMDFDKHVRIGRLFDLTFVAQKQYVSGLSQAGVTGAQWLPLGFPLELVQDPAPPRDIDIAYVGSVNSDMHPRRSALLKALRETFASTSFGRASPAEMGRIYAGAKLVFNRSVNNDVNMRFFEAMGAGAVLLTDAIVDNGVEDLFEVDRHYIVYRAADDLIASVCALLADPARLRAIGDAACDLVRSKHTYRHRADTLVDGLSVATKLARPAATDVFAACLSLGLTADALAVAARAVAGVGGGRFQRMLGTAAGLGVRLLAALVRGIDRLRSAAIAGRHG